MASNQTISAKALPAEIDIPRSGASPLFWAVASFITESEVLLKNARRETEPLAFLTKFQQLSIPFEARGNDLYLWQEALVPQDDPVSLKNSFSLLLVPLLLKLPSPTTVTKINNSLLEQLPAFIREARRVGADIELEGTTLSVAPAKIRAGRFAWQESEEFNQALALLAILAKGKSLLLDVPTTPDWLIPFVVS